MAIIQPLLSKIFYRMSIRTKIVFMILGMAVLFGSGILFFINYQINTSLKEDAVNKTTILAKGLSERAAEPLRAGDLGTLQLVIGEAISQPDVHYCFVTDSAGRVLASSFPSNAVPAELRGANMLRPGDPPRSENLTMAFKGALIDVADIATPIGGGALGALHVGLNISHIEEKIQNLLMTIMIVGFVSLGILSVFTLLFSYIIVAPVRDLMKVAESLGRGDLSKKVSVSTGDELGQLGETLNRTIDRLQGLVHTETDRDKMQSQVMNLLSVVSSAAEGDLTIKAEVTADALGSVADAFNLMITGLMTLVTHASNVAFEIQHSTTDILHASERMKKGAEHQAVQIRNASDSVNAMSHTIQRMAENADAATQTSHKATQAAVKGGASVTETMKGMQRSRSAVQSTSKKIKGLGERSLEIGAIIEVINEIATQTNLLALNAAIEAARAGEQGKGFAVVADEVRKLAERAGRATKDITGLIKGIQVETSEAVTVMEESTREVEEGTRLADQAGAALREIEQIVKQTAGLVTDITRAAGDQVKVTESVVRSMDTISKVTEETTFGVQETVSTIGKLAELSKQLTDAIGRFKLSKERLAQPGAAQRPKVENLPPLVENVTTRDEEIKLGFIE
jgi:methyl-accepting chemotaxis protein